MIVGRVAKTVAGLFTGYSISHVNGRFRADDLMTQLDAVGKRYVIDETTALVRFVIPCTCSRLEHGEKFDAARAASIVGESLQEEIDKIRTLFFNIFAEVVVHSVQGEDEIWLLESAASKNRLYVWEKGD